MEKIFWRKIPTLVICLFALVLVKSQKPVEQIKSTFSLESLEQKITSYSGKKIPIKEVLSKYEGSVLVIDFWASWCQDCILALPKTRKLKEKYPNLKFVYFSLDRSLEQWKRGLEKYSLSNEDNYWFDEGWKNKFNNYIELNWVPRFLVVDEKGNISQYYAISPDDPALIKAIEKSISSNVQ